MHQTTVKQIAVVTTKTRQMCDTLFEFASRDIFWEGFLWVILGRFLFRVMIIFGQIFVLVCVFFCFVGGIFLGIIFVIFCVFFVFLGA